jgi:hypothetical protein
MKYSFLALYLFLAACEVNHSQHDHSSEPKLSAANQALYDEVMRIHDEVMPKHHLLAKYRDSVGKELSQTDVQKDTAKLNRYTNIHKDLDYAYKAMDLWMRNFDTEFAKKTEAEQKAYLEQEKQTIQKVADKMNASLDAAKNRSK